MTVAGLLRCAECGGALTLKKTHIQYQHEVYTCSTYIQ
ncbi:zinc ribbon domain-containing protein [Dorea formicigenerans]|nr:zinc ribbon domain-containing protein [Dorea formicigenerans]